MNPSSTLAPDLVPHSEVHPNWRGSAIRSHIAQLQTGIRSKIHPLSGAPFLILGLNRLYVGVDELSESLFVEVAGNSEEEAVRMAERAIHVFSGTALRFPRCSGKHPWRITPIDSETNFFNTQDTESIRLVHRTTQRIEAYPFYEVLELQLDVLRVNSTDRETALWDALFDYCPQEAAWSGFLCDWSSFPCKPTHSVTNWRKPVAHLAALMRRLLDGKG